MLDARDTLRQCCLQVRCARHHTCRAAGQVIPEAELSAERLARALTLAAGGAAAPSVLPAGWLDGADRSAAAIFDAVRERCEEAEQVYGAGGAPRALPIALASRGIPIPIPIPAAGAVTGAVPEVTMLLRASLVHVPLTLNARC